MVVFKNCTLLAKASKTLGEKIEKGILVIKWNRKNVGIVILIFHKIDIKSKLEEIKKII